MLTNSSSTERAHRRPLKSLWWVTLISVGGLLLAGAAAASPPYPPFCTVPCNLITAAADAVTGAPDPLTNLATQYHSATGKALSTVIIRDDMNQPLPGRSVTLDFSGCGADIRICDTQTDPGVATVCNTKTLTKTTDGTGTVVFRIIGGSNNAGNSAGTTTACCKVYGDGLLLGTVFVSALDQQGTGGVQATDLFLFFSDQGGASTASRSNYNCSNEVGNKITGTDLFLFFASVPGAHLASCGALPVSANGPGTYCIP